ncbi:hypothetical protein K501DRAFT_240525 [Backusella circina FSU 941]|nr:hypothetical protein K501DRAFT_240525 [Backusella circina FSU 941]
MTPDEEESRTYTLGVLTCHILPGAKAREYIVRADSRPIQVVDMLLLFLIGLLWSVYAIVLFFIWFFLKRKSVRQESILSIRDVGIQVKTVYWGGSVVSRFINRSKIEDVIINEGISFWQIKSYMAIMVKGEDKMTVVFEHLLPKLQPVLLRVYQGTRSIIFTEQPIDSLTG